MQRARMAQIRRDYDMGVATAIRAEIFALPHAVSENTRIGQLTPDLLTPGFWLLAPKLITDTLITDY
jgi:hypothetical protein